MPDRDAIAALYDKSYSESDGPEHVPDPKERGWVMEWLDRLEPGVFVDYGCGRGELLAEAARRGWEVVGVELVDEVALETAHRTGQRVISVEAASDRYGAADVLHLGDVLEHLTEMELEMPRILSLLKPGGLLLAQGPLEANGNLYTWVLRLSRWPRRHEAIETPPFHVILATLRGQRALFRRFGLTTVEEHVTEVWWPAPDRVSARDLLRPRCVGLYLLRLASRGLSRVRPRFWGNRYRYAGRKAAFPAGRASGEPALRP